MTYTGWKPGGQARIRFRGAEVGGVRMSRRYGFWLRGYLRALADGLTGKEALLRGGREGGLGGVNSLSDLVVVKKMEAFLQLPDIKQAIRNVYAEVGFELPDAINIHVKHIRGEFTDGKGDPIPPSYAALKDYIAMVTPKEPKRMQVQTQRVPPPREVRADGSPPPMAQRAVGEAYEG